MEIIFDENKGTTFQGNTYPVYSAATITHTNFTQLLQAAHNMIERYQDEETLIVISPEENANTMLLASLLSIIGRDMLKAPRQIVFKVADFRTAMEHYRPYLAFATAATYALRLAQMDADALYKDIESLSYLGLEIKADYIHNTLTLRLPQDNAKKYVFKAANMENTIILSSFIKMLSLMQISMPTDIDLTIILHRLSDNPLQNKPTDELLKKLYWCAKSFLSAE